MTSKASWRIPLAIVTALALVATPLALAQGNAPGDEGAEDDHPSQQGKGRAAEARAQDAEAEGDGNETLEAADNETASNETGPVDNETEDEDDGPPAWVREQQEARRNGSWVPPGLYVALENVPDFVKSRIQGLIDAWKNGTRGGEDADDAATNETATNESSANVTLVEDAADADEAEESDGDSRRGPPSGVHAQGKANAERGMTKALDRVPDFVRAKLTAFWSIFA